MSDICELLAAEVAAEDEEGEVEEACLIAMRNEDGKAGARQDCGVRCALVGRVEVENEAAVAVQGTLIPGCRRPATSLVGRNTLEVSISTGLVG